MKNILHYYFLSLLYFVTKGLHVFLIFCKPGKLMETSVRRPIIDIFGAVIFFKHCFLTAAPP